MDFISEQKFLLVSPKKIRPLASLAKKLTPIRAIDVLPFSGKKASEPLVKVIKSAVANDRVEGASEEALPFKEIRISRALMDGLKLAGITSVEIERLPKSMVIIMTVSRPGVVIGRGGTGIEDIKKFILGIVSEVRKEKIKDMKIDLRVNESSYP